MLLSSPPCRKVFVWLAGIAQGQSSQRGVCLQRGGIHADGLALQQHPFSNNPVPTETPPHASLC